MQEYLGEIPVVVSEHPRFSKHTENDWALLFIQKYGQIEGQHHKAWVLDQVSQILLGTEVIVTQAHWGNGMSEYRFVLGEPSARYIAWQDAMLGKKYQNETREYDYTKGISP